MIDDFIGVFDNVISNELCDELIKVYEDSNKLNFAISRQSMGKEKVKQDNNLVFVTSKQHVKDEIFFEQIQPSIQEFCNLAWASYACLLYTSPSPRDRQKSRMPSSA